MKTDNVSFVSDGLRLEGVLAHRIEPEAAPGIVICHPHPLYGGTMENNVVQALLQGFVSLGYVALAFNFRGVGRSEGTHQAGEGEVHDVRAALDFLEGLSLTRKGGLGVAGYSFGAWVGLRASVKDRRVACVGAISPPVGIFSFDFLEGYDRPVILVSGTSDEFCSPHDVERLAGLLSGPKERKVVSGADHFYFTRAHEASEYLCERFTHYLPPGRTRSGDERPASER